MKFKEWLAKEGLMEPPALTMDPATIATKNARHYADQKEDEEKQKDLPLGMKIPGTAPGAYPVMAPAKCKKSKK